MKFYQIWLDDLFPKARFLDALKMVEKMGHKKRMQMMRMEWINEGKPHAANEDSHFDETALSSREHDGREKTASRIAPIFEKMDDSRPKTPTQNGNHGVDVDTEEDLYGATPKALRQKTAVGAGSQDSLFGGNGISIFGPARTVAPAADGPDDDELDALMAEAEGEGTGIATRSTHPAATTNKAAVNENMDDDDLDALLAEEEMMQATATKPAPVVDKPAASQEEFDDEMEAMAGMDDMW